MPQFSIYGSPGTYNPPVISRFHTPQPGTQERKDIINSIRVPVSHELGQQVEFRVSKLNVGNGFAYVSATPAQPGNKPIDMQKISPVLKDEADAGLLDGFTTLALLKQVGGKWKVLEIAIGSTDFPAPSWAEHHGAPAGIVSGF